MALYLSSYDLRNHATMNQYQELFAALEAMGARRILLSEWAIRRNETSVVIRNHLRQFIHAQDRLLVSELSTTNWAGYNLLVTSMTSRLAHPYAARPYVCDVMLLLLAN